MRTAVLLCCVAMALAPQPSFAQASAPNEEWREHLKVGERLYNLGKFDEAIKEFEAGYAIQPHSLFLYDLGQCYRQLERYEKAIWYFDRYLKSGAVPPDAKINVERFIERMRTALEKREKTTPPTGPLRVQDQLSPPEPAGSKAIDESRRISGFDEQREQREHWYDDGVGWGIAGAGLVAGGGAAWLLVSATDLDQQAGKPQDETRAADLRDRASTRRIFGAITGIGAGALLVGGAIKLVMHPKNERADVSSWRLNIAPYGVVIAGRF